jgi:hypothetical protein
MADSGASDDGGIPLIEPLSRSTSPQASPARKRKAGTELPQDAQDRKKAKKQKKKLKKAQKNGEGDGDDEDFDEELGINRAIGRMDGTRLADLVARKTNRFLGSQLSSVELSDLEIPCTSSISLSESTLLDYPQLTVVPSRQHPRYHRLFEPPNPRCPPRFPPPIHLARPQIRAQEAR